MTQCPITHLDGSTFEKCVSTASLMGCVDLKKLTTLEREIQGGLSTLAMSEHRFWGFEPSDHLLPLIRGEIVVSGEEPSRQWTGELLL
jgi:hypothetical protein